MSEEIVRFMMWSTSLAAGIVATHFFIRRQEQRRFSFGLAGHFYVLAVHQFFWWLSSRAYQSGSTDIHQAIYSYRFIATWCELAMITFTLFVISPALENWFGRWWYVGGAAFGVVLYILGALTITAQ